MAMSKGTEPSAELNCQPRPKHRNSLMKGSLVYREWIIRISEKVLNAKYNEYYIILKLSPPRLSARSTVCMSSGARIHSDPQCNRIVQFIGAVEIEIALQLMIIYRLFMHFEILLSAFAVSSEYVQQ